MEKFFKRFSKMFRKAIESANETVLNSRTHKSSVERVIDQNPPTILHRIAARDKTAVEECLNKHGGVVWALAKHFTDSREEAENAALGIFLDLWKLSDRFDAFDCCETDFVVLIARRWLMKRRMQTVFDTAPTLTSSAKD